MTNPDVVAEVVRLLSSEQVRIAIPQSEFISAERAAEYLGYDRIADEQAAEIVYLPDAEHVERTVHLTRETITLSVAKPLLDGVVNVPTIRRSAALGLEAGMANLARAIDETPDETTVQAAHRVCNPAITVVDGTYSYAGEPHKLQALLASTNTVATSIAAADLVDLDRTAVPHLTTYEADSNAPVDVRGFDVDRLADTVSTSKPNPSTDTGLMTTAYRLYARLTGDLVPPQMLPEGDTDG